MNFQNTHHPTTGSLGNQSPPAAAAELAIGRKDLKAADDFLCRAEIADRGAPEVRRAAYLACVARATGAGCTEPRPYRLDGHRLNDELMSGYPAQFDSRYLGYVPPRLKKFILKPYAEREDFPEVEGLAETLAQRFPSLQFETRPLAKTPEGAIDPARAQVAHDGSVLRRGQIVDDLLFSVMPRDTGLIAIVDRDLSPVEGNFLFATMELRITTQQFLNLIIVLQANI